MKKISLLIALALCITIGGVYAAWSYSSTSNIVDVNQTKALQMTGAVDGGAAGAFNVDTSGLSLVIDDANGDHRPELVATGSVVVTFTPGAFANADIKNNGVTAYTQLVLTNNSWTYDDGHGEGAQPVLTLNGATHTIGTVNSGETIKWTKEDGVFKYTFDAANIAGHITLTPFYLDTLAKYSSYNNNLNAGLLLFEVGDGTAD